MRHVTPLQPYKRHLHWLWSREVALISMRGLCVRLGRWWRPARHIGRHTCKLSSASTECENASVRDFSRRHIGSNDTQTAAMLDYLELQVSLMSSPQLQLGLSADNMPHGCNIPGMNALESRTKYRQRSHDDWIPLGHFLLVVLWNQALSE